MAQKVEILYLDDVDGSKASETVKFGLDGTAYEIDLSEGNANELRGALEKFVGGARKVTAGAKRGRKPGQRRAKRSPAAEDGSASEGTPAASSNGAASSREEKQAIRAWARKAGFDIGDRGRIPAEITEAYAAAHAG